VTSPAAVLLAAQARLKTRFEAALDSLWMAFQPIVTSAAGEVHAYEALVRSDEATLAQPSALFDAADRLHRAHDLGRAIRRAVARTVAQVPAHVELFVNLDADDLNDPQLLDERNPLVDEASRVVFEITERASLRGVRGVDAILRQLRARGFRFAIDDLGTGHAQSSLEPLQPEYVKLDVSLVRNIHRHAANRELIHAVATESRGLNRHVVAEGVEQELERDALLDLGCGLQQGYLFGRPSRLSV
jgi:EAL domain-containing protein (putative c-di-GMP-specific phosphodiesterase class I)